MDDYCFLPFLAKSPYIRELLKHTEDTIVFYGYFYIEDEILPLERIMIYKDIPYHIEFTKKIIKEEDKEEEVHSDDTIKEEAEEIADSDDSIAGRITFFPMNFIELHYKIIKVLTHDEIENVKKQIDEKETELEERNNRFRKLREEREYAEMQERYKHMKFL
jgi:flagellar motility protein MotE (MotC chaperone)